MEYSLASSTIILIVSYIIPHSLSASHPLDPLSPEEIDTVRVAVSTNHHSHQFYFITITLIEPPKSVLKREKNPGRIERRALAVIIRQDNWRAYEIIVNLVKKSIEGEKMLPKGVQPMLAQIERQRIISTVLKDTGIQGRLDELVISIKSIVCVTWVGSKCAGHEPEFCGKRLSRTYFYFRNYDGDNPFAHPLNFVAIVDIIAQKVLAIDELPIYANYSRARAPNNLPLPRKSLNYNRAFLPKNFFREGIHPLNTSSEGGPSFKIKDRYQVDWQGFRMSLGFNIREGLVLHNVSFKGVGERRRSLLYRLSFSELVIPYADPRPPFNAKVSFDFSEYGMVASFDSFLPGIDCLPESHLIDIFVNDGYGQALKVPNAICISEVDAGILHRHVVDGQITVARAQNLVLAFMITAGNYDYVFKYIFHQDGSLEVEVGATGLLTINLFLGKSAPWGSLISEGVMAQHHQHIFCLRIDTSFDGERNSVSTLDVLPMKPDPKLNPKGNGFFVKETLLTTSLNSVTDPSRKTQRVWKITNPKSISGITGSSRGYKLITNNRPLMLAGKNSMFARRAGFAKHATWVLPYDEGELFAAGKYLMQSHGEDGVAKWVKRNESIVARDIVVFHTFGFTHVPSTDEFPLMRMEKTGISLTPCNFFDRYQGLNVPMPPELMETGERNKD